MIEGKDPQALLAPLGSIVASITAVPVPGHDSHARSAFGSAAVAAGDAETAVSRLPDDGSPVLIAGSLYLAGDVLRRNGEVPD